MDGSQDLRKTGVTREVTTKATTSGERHTLGEDAATCGGPPQKKQKKQNVGQRISEEDRRVLQQYKDLENETRVFMGKVQSKLENIQCTETEEKELLSKLTKKASDLKDKTLLDKIYIGVFGKTGDGKSSLINAVLHEQGLLPTSSESACTSSIINVQTHSGCKFKADIEFITEEEWNKELEDLKELCENQENEVDDSETNEIVESAEEKLRAVYGDIGLEQSYQELLEYNIIPKNNKNSLSEVDAQTLSHKLKCYVTKKSSEEGRYFWPLVKSVTISVPKSNGLPEGLVLTDFPRTGDSNKARDEIWKEYVTRCSSVLIVSAIHRADSDKVGDEIFSKIVNTAYIGGQCQDVTFVCTKTDQLSTAEYIKEKKIRPEDMNISVKDSPEERKAKETRFCVLKRNKSVKENILNSCKQKWNKRKRLITGECKFSEDDIHVFTVSSHDYWRFHDDHHRTNFSDSETEIPGLKKHIIDVYLKNRKKIVSDYVSEVRETLQLLTSLNDAEASESEEHTMTREGTLQKKLKRQNIGPQISEDDTTELQQCKEMEKETRMLIDTIHTKLESVVCTDSEEKELLNKLKIKAYKLKGKTLLDKIYIGVFGKTGDGKSSLINAVFNEQELLPISSSSACTSSIINVQTHSGRKFKAIVEFITKEEWNKELKDLKELCDNQESEVDDSETNETVESAEEKLRAVYGEKGREQSYQELLEYNIIPKNNNISLSAVDAKTLSHKLKCYVSKKSSEEGRYFWPLVKSVTISLPKSNGLPEGLVLTDFPGTGDSNKARDEIWKKYLTRCRSVWIVSVTHRADSDKIADQIFSKTVSTADIGGQCQDVTFVFTKTDQLSTSDYIREEMIRPEDMNISDNDSPEERKTKETRFCVLKRNKSVKENILKFCKQKWNKKKRQIPGEYEFSGNDIHVFTVSSKEYWEIHHDDKTIFSDSETEIPGLKKHIIDVYLKNRKKVVSDYVSQARGMLHLLISLNDTNANEFYKRTFTDIDSKLEVHLKEFTHQIENLAITLECSLIQGAETAEKKCMTNIGKWLERENNSNQGFHNTLKAICQKDGVHISRKFGEIDVNYELALPLYNQMESVFHNMFQMKKSTRNNIKGQLDVFETSMITIINENVKKKSSGRIEESWGLRKEFLLVEVNGLFNAMKNYITEKKKSIYSSVSGSVQHDMKPAYEKASKKNGLKLMQQMKRILTEHIDIQKATIFTTAVDKMMNEFNEMKDDVESKLKAELQNTMKLGLAQWPGHTTLPDFTQELEEMIEKSSEILSE